MNGQINTAAAILRLSEAWETRFNKSYLQADVPFSERICQIETSNAKVQVYNLLIAVPFMKRFRDRRELQKLKFAQHRVTNEEFSVDVDVPVRDVQNDAVGQYSNMFDNMGLAARRNFDILLGDLLPATFSTLDYTGTNFFAADKQHVPGLVNGGTFTNLMTEKPSVASYEKALQLLAYIKDAENKPFNLGTKRVVICSSKWAPTFRRILNAETIGEEVGDGAAAVTNIHKGSAELIEFPYLNTAAAQDNWFVMDRSWPGLSAFIQQTEVAPTFAAQTAPDSDAVFNRKVYAYQGYMRGAVGLGLPQLAVGSTGADAAL